MWRVRIEPIVGVGGGRHVGAWAMLVSMMLLVIGIAYTIYAVDALDRQAADLDPDQARMETSLYAGYIGLILASAALSVFLLALLVYGISSTRARRKRVEVSATPAHLAVIAGVGVTLAILFATLAPGGPLVHAASLISGGGGPAGATEIRFYNGTLTGATIGGTSTEEDLHSVDLVAHTGAIRLRMQSGGATPSSFAIAILEAPDNAGGWQEVARTSAGPDVTLDVPMKTYSGNLRLRVHMSDGTLGQVEYGIAVSFAPAR